MHLRRGSELFWPPVGRPALYRDLLSILSSGFAKKTFISYSVTFKENFRQGLVVGIDLKNQTVLLEDGQVSPAGAGRSQLTSGAPWDVVAGGRIPGLVSSGMRRPHPCPAPRREQMPPEPRPDPSGHRRVAQTFLEPSLYARHCLKPHVFSFNAHCDPGREVE